MMDGIEGGGRGPGVDPERILQQLDRMVSAGRITPAEAERLRAADSDGAFQAVLGEVRARHASAGLAAAVAEGRLTQPDADDALHQLRRGEHAAGLRKLIRPHRRPPAAE